MIFGTPHINTAFLAESGSDSGSDGYLSSPPPLDEDENIFSDYEIARSDLIPLDMSKATHEVIDLLHEVGNPLVVGGAVRDHLFQQIHGKEAVGKDVDIEVYGVTLEEMESHLRRHGLSVNTAGKSFGILKAVRSGEEFDISVPRTDSRAGTGHQGFEVDTDPEMSVEQAAHRRDFTVNAIGYDPSTERYIDPTGRGMHDLISKTLSAVDHKTFAEDPLRVLRAAQFSARFDMDVDEDTLSLCATLKNEYDSLSTERVWGEMEKLYGRGESLSKGFHVLRRTGWSEKIGSLAPETEDRMSVVSKATQSGGMVAGIALASMSDIKKLTNNKSMLRQVGVLHSAVARAAATADPRDCDVRQVQRSMNAMKLDRDQWDAVLVGALGESAAKSWSRRFTDQPTPPIINGQTLIDRGVPVGRSYRTILAEALRSQDQGEFTDNGGAARWLSERGL